MQALTIITAITGMAGIATALSPKKPPLPPSPPLGAKPPAGPLMAPPAAYCPPCPAQAPSPTVNSAEPMHTQANDNLYTALKCDFIPESYDTKYNFWVQTGPENSQNISRPKYGYYRLWCPPMKMMNFTVDYETNMIVGKDMGRKWDAPPYIAPDAENKHMLNPGPPIHPESKPSARLAVRSPVGPSTSSPVPSASANTSTLESMVASIASKHSRKHLCINVPLAKSVVVDKHGVIVGVSTGPCRKSSPFYKTVDMNKLGQPKVQITFSDEHIVYESAARGRAPALAARDPMTDEDGWEVHHDSTTTTATEASSTSAPDMVTVTAVPASAPTSDPILVARSTDEDGWEVHYDSTSSTTITTTDAPSSSASTTVTVTTDLASALTATPTTTTATATVEPLFVRDAMTDEDGWEVHYDTTTSEASSTITLPASTITIDATTTSTVNVTMTHEPTTMSRVVILPRAAVAE